MRTPLVNMRNMRKGTGKMMSTNFDSTTAGPHGPGQDGTTPFFRRGARMLLAPLLAASALISGCVTELEPGQEPLRPRPRAVPEQPTGLDTTRVQAFPSAYLRDTNGNTQGDTIEVLVYLWSEPYPFPIHDRGTLTFDLFRSGLAGNDEALLARWSFPPESMITRQDRTHVGPCYYFRLSLFEAERFDSGRGDNLGVSSADLLVAYFDALESPDDVPRRLTTGVSTLQLDLPLSN